MVSLYYALPKEKESDCQKFNLSVQLLPGNLSLHVTILSVVCLLSQLVGLVVLWEKQINEMLIKCIAPTVKMDEEERVYKLKIEVM